MDNQPIAIIGMAGRFPQADNIKEFWTLLSQGEEAFADYPSDRWKHESLVIQGDVKPGHTYCSRGGFIDTGTKFDANFFGIKDSEAKRMDPQQGVMLEAIWHALEDAMIPPSSIRGTDTGVFFGVSTRDYDRRLSNQISELDLRASTGACGAIVANRASYTFGLTGPSITIDSACASSLSAIHYAMQSLILEESSMAIAGGVHLILSPANTIAFSQSKVLSSQGHCKSFGEGSDGYIFGEGCGVLILKKLVDAEKDGNKVWAVIEGSANNHNGISNGLSSPYGPAQKKVMEKALQRAKITPDKVGYIEAHGTGSFIGDAVEINAIKQVYGKSESPCYIGSVKSNIGHLEACAGVAGLIKTVLSMKEETITQSLHTETINKHLRLDSSSLAIAQQKIKWNKNNSKRYAAVSSFSFGGANVHMILSDYNKNCKSENINTDLLLLSAKTESSLKYLLNEYKQQIESLNENDFQHSISAMCTNSSLARDHLGYRIAIEMSSKKEMLEEITLLIDSHDHSSYGKEQMELRVNIEDYDFETIKNLYLRESLLGILKELKGLPIEYSDKKITRILTLIVFFHHINALPDVIYVNLEYEKLLEKLLADESICQSIFGIHSKQLNCQLKSIEKQELLPELDLGKQLLLYFKNAYINGKQINWELLGCSVNHDIEIPLYAFDRSRHWEIPESKPEYRI